MRNFLLLFRQGKLIEQVFLAAANLARGAGAGLVGAVGVAESDTAFEGCLATGFGVAPPEGAGEDVPPAAAAGTPAGVGVLARTIGSA